MEPAVFKNFWPWRDWIFRGLIYVSGSISVRLFFRLPCTYLANKQDTISNNSSSGTELLTSNTLRRLIAVLLDRSITPTIVHTIARSLDRTVAQSRGRSLASFLTGALIRSVARWIAHWIALSIACSLDRALANTRKAEKQPDGNTSENIN